MIVNLLLKQNFVKIVLCRAIICKGDKVIPMSFDFTPESERERIKYLVRYFPI